MRIRTWRLGPVAALGLALVFSAARSDAAPVLIDDFTSSQSLTVATGSDVSSLNDPSVLSGNRDLILTVTAPLAGNDATIASGVSGGALSLSFDAGVTGVGAVQWDGPNTDAGLGHVGPFDLTGGGTNDRLQLSVLSADLPFDLTFRVYGGSDADYLVYNLAVPSNTVNSDFLIPFSAFTVGGGGGASFGSVSALSLVLDPDDPGAVGADIIVSQISAVPEPSALALLGIGGLALLRRRRK